MIVSRPTVLEWAPNIFHHNRSSCISPERNILSMWRLAKLVMESLAMLAEQVWAKGEKQNKLVRTYCISLFRLDGSSTRSAGCEIGNTLSRKERWERWRETQREAAWEKEWEDKCEKAHHPPLNYSHIHLICLIMCILWETWCGHWSLFVYLMYSLASSIKTSVQHNKIIIFGLGKLLPPTSSNCVSSKMHLQSQLVVYQHKKTGLHEGKGKSEA